MQTEVAYERMYSTIFSFGEEKGMGLKSVWLMVPNTPGWKNPEYTALDSNLLILSFWESMNKATVLWGGVGRESFL